jgi:hypothetical protein
VPDPVRIGNCSGFYGDRIAAMREMLEGGHLDVLTGDYLAELTMLILYRARAKDPSRGYATSFLRQLEDCLALAVERDVRIVTNAGGLNPHGCAQAVTDLARRSGLDVPVAWVTGDDLMPQLEELRAAGERLSHLDTGAPLPATPLTANAYLGGFGIAAALRAGARVVVTGRVTDAALVTGPAAWWHDWGPDEFDQLAGAVVAGHVLECGAQATGGNYAFFREVPGVEHLGFPLAEIAGDGSSVVTKHPDTGGEVSAGTVTAQLLYEIGGPQYLGPDVVARFDTIRLDQVGPDRVRISGVRGEPPPPTTKVSVNLLGGFRNSVTFLVTGLDVEAKAALVTHQLEQAIGGRDAVREFHVALARTDRADPSTNEAATASLRITVMDDDPEKVGRRFSAAAVELALASYPGATVTAPPGDAAPYGEFWPTAVPNELVTHTAVLPDGSRRDIPPPRTTATPAAPTTRRVSPGPDEDVDTVRVPLGRVFGARSGDKGGTANLGVWARDDAGWAWLRDRLTVAALAELLPETAAFPVRRHELANLRAVNFEIPGLLRAGVASSTRQDPQAKGLGEWLRAREVSLPAALLAVRP